jgi:hypothetical protein
VVKMVLLEFFLPNFPHYRFIDPSCIIVRDRLHQHFKYSIYVNRLTMLFVKVERKYYLCPLIHLDILWLVRINGIFLSNISSLTKVLVKQILENIIASLSQQQSHTDIHNTHRLIKIGKKRLVGAYNLPLCPLRKIQSTCISDCQ